MNLLEHIKSIFAPETVEKANQDTLPKANFDWAKTKLLEVVSYIVPGFSESTADRKKKIIDALVKRPDVVYELFKNNVEGFSDLPEKEQKKMLNAIYYPEHAEALDAWPWFDPVFALSGAGGLAKGLSVVAKEGAKALVKEGLKAGAKTIAREAGKELGKTAVATTSALAGETGTAVVGETLEEKHPLASAILAPLVGTGIGVASEKLASRLVGKKYLIPYKESEEKIKPEEIQLEIPEPKNFLKETEGQAEKISEKPLHKGSLTLDIENIFKEAGFDKVKQLEEIKVDIAKKEPKVKINVEPKVKTEVEPKVETNIEPKVETKVDIAKKEPDIELNVGPEIKAKQGIEEVAEKTQPKVHALDESLLDEFKEEIVETTEKTSPGENKKIFHVIGEGWAILKDEKGKFYLAFEKGDLGDIVKTILTNEKDALDFVEPRKSFVLENSFGPIERVWLPSSSPAWFKNQGFSVKRVKPVLEKALQGEPLTEKQAELIRYILEHKSVRDEIKGMLSWIPSGEGITRGEIELYSGIHIPKMLKQSFELLSDLKKSLAEQAVEKGHYKIGTILGYGKEFEPKDIRSFGEKLKSYLWNLEDVVLRYGDVYPEIKDIEVAQKWIREPKANRWATFVEESILKPIERLNDQQKERIFKILYRESFTGKKISQKVLQSLTPEERNVYNRVRRVLVNIWNDVKASYKETIAKYIDHAKITEEEKNILREALEKADPNLVPKEIEARVPKFVHYLIRYSEMKGVPYYMPQTRHGWMVILKEGKETKYAFDFPSRAEAVKFYKALKSGDTSKIQEWAKTLNVPLQPSMFTNIEIRPVTKMPVELSREMDLSRAITYLHEVAKQKRISQDKLAEFYEALIDDLDTFIKMQGWSSHLIKRKNIPGFTIKFEEAYPKLKAYLYGYGLSKSKKEAMEKAYGAFYRLVNRPGYKPEGLIQYLEDYLRYSFGTPEHRAIRTASQFVTVYYLGMNLKSALVNATQNFTSGVAAYLHHGIPIKYLLNGLKHVFSPKLPLVLQKALNKAIKEGFLDAKQINEALTTWKNTQSVIDKAMLPFRLVEVFVNRATHFLGAFDYLYNVKKLPFEDAFKKAIEVMYEGHFWASRYNRAPIERNLGRLATALQTFTYFYIRKIFHYWNNKDFKSVFWLLASPVILGGLIATPGGELVYQNVVKPLYKKFTNEDLDIKALTSRKKAFIKYGPIGEISPSFSYSVGVGFSEDPQRWLAGPVQGILDQLKKAKKLYEREDYIGALIEMMPLALRNALKALTKKELETFLGQPISYFKRELSTGERVMSAFGLKSKEIEKQISKKEILTRAQEERKKILQKFAYQLHKALEKKDSATINSIIDNIIAHNARIVEKIQRALEDNNFDMAVYYQAFLISPQEIRASLRQKERAYIGIKKSLQGIGEQ